MQDLKKYIFRWELKDVAPLIGLAVLIVFFTLTTMRGGNPFDSDFLQLGVLKQILSQGSVLAIVSVGLTFVLLCAEIDLAVGMSALWTACFCGWLWVEWIEGPKQANLPAWSVVLVLIVPLASSLLLGLINGSLTVASRLPSFIISLAMMNIADGASRYLTKSQTFDVPAILKTLGNEGIEVTKTFEIPYSALLAAFCFLVGHVVLQHTRFGRYIYMTGGNREAARLAGVRTGGIVIACLAISAVMAGIGGLVNAGKLHRISLDQNADLLLSAVACVVLGGTSLFGGEGSMGKTVIGVLTFTTLRVGLNQISWIDDLARPFLLGLVLMGALVINGLLARKRN